MPVLSMHHRPRGVLWFLWRQRLVRFAVVGGVGIPINTAFLWFFHSALHLPLAAAWICAFEPSALINFYANQRITYHEQTHVRGWDWLVRAVKWQASSLTGQLVNIGMFAIAVHAGMHYLQANVLGIVAAFIVNFVISRRFVFTPGRSHAPAVIGDSAAEYEIVA
jgi:dolichol-phosphate mannosyltransferase